MLLPLLLALAQAPPAARSPEPLAADELRAVARMAGLAYAEDELEQLSPSLERLRAALAPVRARALDNALQPALVFSPLVPGLAPLPEPLAPRPLELPAAERPADLADLAWADVPTLAALVRARRVSVRELVELSLARLERLDPLLVCVVTLLPERALARADALDRALAEDPGAWSGPLWGLPFGAKDLFAARGAPTSWGSPLHREVLLDFDAAAVRRLEEAGAVLVAKLSLGELAWGDEWFGGTTKNPWKPEQGSSGSSAGSASAVAAGCVPFALGTETLGSIVSPAQRCGASGLRPSFGRVSRDGAMTLCWSMDKVGVLARSAVDCGIVLAAIAGPDGKDPSVVERPLGATAAAPLAGARVGWSEAAFARASEAERAVLADLDRLGAELVPFEPPELPLEAMLVTLEVEAASAFDDLVRSGRVRELVRQGEQAWPNVMRRAELVPAVEYLRAQRLRSEACLAMGRALAELDLVVHPPYAEGMLGATNLTGQPSLTVPCGFREDGTPIGISFTANLFDETRLVALVAAWQEASGHHRRHPDL